VRDSPDKSRQAGPDVSLTLFWAALGYSLFVIYGSLLPFELNGLSLEDAWTRFRDIPLLKLGVGSRADLVANLILYIPVGFLFMGALVGESRLRIVSVLGAVLTSMIVVGLALAIEFTQQFFPPRTVSLNDLYAEGAGGALGILVWTLAGRRLLSVWRNFAMGGPSALHAILVLYTLAYLFLSLFPYDFLLSAVEWREHLASGKAGWLFAGDCGLVCLAKLLPEMIAAIPFGLLLSGRGRSPRPPFAAIATMGLLLGLGIETLQLTIESGVSQGASVFSRAAGVTIGALLPSLFSRWDAKRMRPLIQAGLLLVLAPYAGLLAWLNHWFAASWLTGQVAFSRLTEVRFIPLYYHYYTAEAVALVSVVFQLALYSPLGAGIWLWRQRTQGRSRGSLIPALFGFGAAGVIEMGKLFITGQHPDPTNILLATCGAGMTHALLRWLFPSARSIVSPHVTTHASEHVDIPQPGSQGVAKTSPIARLSAVGMLVAALLSLLGYPLGWGPVLLLLALAGVLWKWPGVWLVVVPATMPLLDLSYLSGRLFWSEFDTLLLLSLAIAYARWRKPQTALYPGRLPLAVFTVSALVSTVIGLLPLAPLDLNAFTHYTSPYNALRAAKGLVFALAFWPLIKAEWQANASRASVRLALGMTLGLASELGYVIWERVTYSGLWNFDTDYRITGSFPGMNIGGASIEAYLVLTAPFVWLWAWQRRQAWAMLIAGGLYALAAYGVMVTFSRGGQAAFAIATLLALAGFMRLLWIDRTRVITGSVALMATVMVAGLVAWPIVSGRFSQSRLATIKTDIGTRAAHWRDAFDILGQAGNPALGTGLGAFPAAFYLYSSAPTRPASYAFVREGSNAFLRLGGGESLYFEQVVPVKPDHEYRILMDLRSKTKSATLTIPLCEKALLYSFTCAWNTLKYSSDDDRWVHRVLRVRTGHFGPPGSVFQRPVKLSLFNQGVGTMIDVDNVALLDEAGHNLVRNGDFLHGMQRWFFSTDSHLAWHEKNLFMHVLFEQGWVGLAAFISLLGAVMLTLQKRAGSDAFALTQFVSLTAFLVVGMVDSLIDEPRLDFLFFWLLAIALISGARPSVRRRRIHGRSAIQSATDLSM
jgi:glycopeptide antibiotics resistance protein